MLPASIDQDMSQPMNIKIYHNPRCSKSRQTLEIIRQKGIEPEIIEYLKTPPDMQELAALAQKLGIEDIRDMMRKGEEPYRAQDLKNPAKTPETLVKAMADNPVLIERPIVVTAKGAAICRPPENVLALL